jgi:hypothetical protein
MLLPIRHRLEFTMLKTVLLADLPRLLDDIVSGALEDTGGIRLVRNPRTEGDLAAAALSVDADVVVVVREDPGDLASIDQNVAALAGRSLLALTPAGHSAWLYRCRCEAMHMRELSTISLREAVRACELTTTPDPVEQTNLS